WASALPQPKSSPPSISAEETANLIKTVKVGKDLIIVDTRRTDFEDYFIHGAINLPAHSFCQTLPGLVPLLSPVPLVIFHCNSCGKVTSRGRLVASWYQDALNEHGITTSKAKYLEGGIKGWIERYAQDPDLAVKL
ncbi:hypothetical protein BD410DRAFT_739839, partial [Rickenella mellea]